MTILRRAFVGSLNLAGQLGAALGESAHDEGVHLPPHCFDGITDLISARRRHLGQSRIGARAATVVLTAILPFARSKPNPRKQ
jgi:hypothetical protein